MTTGQSDNLQIISTYIKAQKEYFKNRRIAAQEKWQAGGYNKLYEYTNELNSIGGAVRALNNLNKLVQWQLTGIKWNKWFAEYLEPETKLTDFERYVNNDNEIETL